MEGSLILGILALLLGVLVNAFVTGSIRRDLRRVNQILGDLKINDEDFREITDNLSENLDATNERMNDLVRYNEENIPVIEAMKERGSRYGKN